MPLEQNQIVQAIRTGLPGVLGVYAFGSQVRGEATSESDLDLAVLVKGYADPLALWRLSSELADLAGCHVDLLDLRAATTVMQFQVLSAGQTWWSAGYEASVTEAAMLSDKVDLDEARSGVLSDIMMSGTVHGR